MQSEPVLVSGATGYVGGRLVPRLLDSGFRVRVLGRALSKLESRPWAGHKNLEMAQADFLDYASLEKAAEGCWAAFYLVHSMNPRHKDFARADRNAALNMAKAASRAGWASEGDVRTRSSFGRAIRWIFFVSSWCGKLNGFL